MTTEPHNYDEDKIKTLSSLEHIRKRTGMYIGRTGDGSDYDDGIYILLQLGMGVPERQSGTANLPCNKAQVCKKTGSGNTAWL